MARRIKSATDLLCMEPRPRGAKALTGQHGWLRIRVGDYRIVYEVRDSTAGLFVTFLNLHLNVGKYQAIVAGLALVVTAVQNPDGLTSTSTSKGPAVLLGRLRDRAGGEYQKRLAGRTGGRAPAAPGEGGLPPDVKGDTGDLHHPVV